MAEAGMGILPRRTGGRRGADRRRNRVARLMLPVRPAQPGEAQSRRIRPSPPRRYWRLAPAPSPAGARSRAPASPREVHRRAGTASKAPSAYRRCRRPRGPIRPSRPVPRQHLGPLRPAARNLRAAERHQATTYRGLADRQTAGRCRLTAAQHGASDLGPVHRAWRFRGSQAWPRLARAQASSARWPRSFGVRVPYPWRVWHRLTRHCPFGTGYLPQRQLPRLGLVCGGAPAQHRMGQKHCAAGIEHGSHQPQGQNQSAIHAKPPRRLLAGLISVAPVKQQRPKQTVN